MVDFHSPAIIEDDFLAVVNFWHVVDGIFIWEFFISLEYELSVIRGNRPYLWTTWIYSLTRVCTLVSVIINIIGLDSSTPINCQLWVIFLAIFSYLAFAAASLLIVIRIIAIWERNIIVVAIAICAWSTNVAFFIHSTVVVQSAWVPEQSVCGVLNSVSTNKCVVSTFVTDVVLLLTMLVGLLRLRRRNTMFGFGQLLWRQGLIWLFLATVSELPPSVFIILNLNDPFNLMFQAPALVWMTIAATRMYRSLTDFPDSGRSAFDTSPTPITDTKQIFEVQIPLDKVEVAVHRPFADHPPANTGQYASHHPYSAAGLSQNPCSR